MRPLAALLLLLASAGVGAQQPCGGVERWAVKMAADAGAAQINATPVPTTLHALVGLQRPTLPSDDFTRTSAERAVFVVDARLVRFKLESGKTGDADYHLVISDHTGHYSPGGPGTTPSQHSFVAEVADPDCVMGRNSTVTTTSRFATQLQSTSDKFLAQFPNITSGWNEAGGIAVRLTGVAFFDRDHGQVGRAPNGLELHPLLDIAFGPQPPLAGLGPTGPTIVALSNANFELGEQDWLQTPGVISSSAAQPANSGQWKAWLGGYGEVHTDRVARIVTLPSAQTITLTFHLHVSTEESNVAAYDKFYVRVRGITGPTGTLRATLKTLSNLNAAQGFSLQSVDLSAFRGQTIRISLEAVEDNGSVTSFVVDDIAIVVEP